MNPGVHSVPDQLSAIAERTRVPQSGKEHVGGEMDVLAVGELSTKQEKKELALPRRRGEPKFLDPDPI